MIICDSGVEYHYYSFLLFMILYLCTYKCELPINLLMEKRCVHYYLKELCCISRPLQLVKFFARGRRGFELGMGVCSLLRRVPTVSDDRLPLRV